MASIGSAAAEGLQSGFNMGLQYDQAQEAKRSRALSQAQQAEELGMRKMQFDTQLERQRQQDERQQTTDQYQQLKDAHADVIGRVAALQGAGQQVPPELTQEYSAVRDRLNLHRAKVLAPQLATERQQSLDFFSGVKAGRVDPLGADVTPAQLYRHVSLATGRTPEEITQAASAVQQIQEGHQSGNEGLMLQGVNALAAPDLRAGVGQPSPHGGTIVKKEIVKLVPAQDANGNTDPNKVYPVVRVYTDQKGPDGAPLYYDAPLTKNRTSDPSDPIVPVDLTHAFDYMGNLGTLAAALQDPRAQAKLAQGAKEVGDKTRADLDEMNALGRAELAKHAQGAVQQKIQAIKAQGLPPEDEARAIRIAMGIEAPPKAAPGGVQSFEARVQAIKGLGLTPEAEKAAIKDLTLRGGGKISGDVPVKGTAGKGAGSGGGTTGGGKGTTGTAPAVDEHRQLAAEWLVTGKPPFRGAKQLMELDKTRAKLMKEAGLSTSDVIQQGTTFKVKEGAAQEVEKMYAAVESFSKTVDANMKVLEDLSTKLPRSDIPVISKGQLAVERVRGNPVLAQYEGALQSVKTEVARIITQPRLTGQLTDSARKEIGEFLHGSLTHPQLMALMKTLRTEMSNREAGIVAVRSALQADRTGMAERLNAPGTVSTPAKALSPQDQAAVDWAKNNPRDPRAAKILQMHGM